LDAEQGLDQSFDTQAGEGTDKGVGVVPGTGEKKAHFPFLNQAIS
jgi:hypothetical protein